ncbi:MAG: fibronectin type III domain-containing protein [Bacteroidales bacterium]|nr:fibronectin type III domain-containing protein [Bacteroidales bacterium]
MKKLMLLFMAVVMSVASLQLLAQDTLTVADGTAYNEYVPVYGYYADDAGTVSQCIYPEALLTNMLGRSIQEMTFYAQSEPSSAWTATFQVKVGATSTSSFTNLLPSPSNTVHTGSLTVNSGKMTIVFSSPFVYSGGNLLIEISVTNPGDYSRAYFYGESQADMSIYEYAYGGTVQSFIPKCTFVYSSTGVSCLPVSGVTASNVTGDAADITWTSNGDESQWEVYVTDDATEVVDDNTAATDVVYTESYSLTNLESSTNYYVYVRANCGSETSTWSLNHFKTSQTPAQLPYTCNFEDETENGSWEFIYNGTNKWHIGSAVAASGSSSLYVSNDDGSSNLYSNNNASTTWAYRDIDFGTSAEYVLSFQYRVQGESATYDWVKVYLGTPTENIPLTGSYSGVTVPGAELLGTYYNQPTWQEESIVIPSTHQGVQRLYFLWWNDASGGSNPPGAIDSITIVGSDCGSPSAVTIDTVTSSTFAFHFTPALESDYSWQAVILTPNDTIDENMAVDLTDTLYEFTDLTADTYYKVYVRTNCGGDYSAWTSPIADRTRCDVVAAPFSENFAGFDANPSLCWERYTGLANDILSGDSVLTPTTDGWYYYLNTSSVFPALHPKLNIYGSYCKYWLVSPAIDLSALSTPTLIFDMALTKYGNSTAITPGSQADDKFMIVVSTDNGATWSAANAIIWSNDSTATYSYDSISNAGQETVISLAQYAGQTVRIAFYGESTATGGDNDLHIANVRVDEEPTCTRPTNLTAGQITDSEITIYWTEEGDATAWNVAYGPVGFNVANATPEMVTDTFFTLDNLNANVSLEFYVQSDCGGSTSSWMGPLAATTLPGMPAELPYACSFDNEDENAAWTLVNGSETNKWYIGIPSGAADSILFVSSNGIANNYNINSSSYVWAFRDIQFGDGAEFDLSFDWKAQGESCCDYIKAFIGAPAPVIANSSTPPTGAVVLSTSNLNQQSSWQHLSVTLNSTYANTTKRLYFLWQNDGSVGTDPAGAIDNISISASMCGAPTALAASNITSDGFDFTFNPAMSSDGAWEYVVTTSSSPLGATPEQITDNSVSVTGLSAATSYNVFVRTVCGDGGESAWSPALTVITECANISALPYINNFDGYGTGEGIMPACWTKINTYSSDRPYITTTNYSAPGSLYFYAGASGTYNMAVMPEIDQTIPVNTLQATFMYRNYYASDRLIVGVMTDPQDASTFVAVDTVQASAVQTWEEVQADLTSYTGTGQFIAFRNEYTTSAGYAYIDNLVIDLAPDCSAPANFAFSNLTGTSVDLTWEDFDSQSWEIYVYADGQTADFNNAETVTGTTYYMQDLTGNTAYHAYVRAICTSGNGYSNWAHVDFMTPSASLAQTPYFTDWSDSDENAEWALVNGTENNKWYIGVPTGGTDTILFVSENGTSNSYSDAASAVWAYRDIQFGDGAEFTLNLKWKCYGESSYDYLRVFIGDPAGVIAGNNSNPTDATQLGSNYLNLQDNWQTLSAVLDGSYANSVKRLYFLWRNDGSVNNPPAASIDTVEILVSDCGRPYNVMASNIDAHSADVTFSAATASDYAWEYALVQGTTSPDDASVVPVAVSTTTFTVDMLTPQTFYRVYVRTDCGDGYSEWSSYAYFTTPESCPKPTQVVVNNIEMTTADVAWNENGSATAWNIEYGPTGFAHGQGTVVSAITNPFTLTGLTAGTAYDVYVQADCGPGDNSSWETASFITPACDATDQCTYTFALTDSYGDGWNGAYVTVEQNGVVVATIEAVNHHLENNATTDNIPVSLCDGIATTIEWHSGNYDSECGLTITDPNGNVIFTQNNMSSLASTTLVTFTTNCSGAPVVTCDAPTNVAASNITTAGATITWTAGGSETAWNLQYKTTASSSWSNSIAVNGTPSYTLSNLTAATAYNVRVQANCGDATSNWAEGTFTTANGAGTSCDAPTNLTATGMTVNSVVLNWNQADASVNSWTINYKKSSDNNWTSVTANAHPYTLTGLEYNTVYDVKVAANCDGTTSDYTAVVNFRTAGDGVEDYVLTNSINLYPNPATTTVTIQSANGMMKSVEVYDVYGKMLNMVEVNDAQVTMNIANYAAGTYFVRVNTENGMVTKRIVKR